MKKVENILRRKKGKEHFHVTKSCNIQSGVIGNVVGQLNVKEREVGQLSADPGRTMMIIEWLM